MSEGITLKRIIDMDEAAELSSSDYALVDSATGGPKKFALGNELSSLKEDFSDLSDRTVGVYSINGYLRADNKWGQSNPVSNSVSYVVNVKPQVSYFIRSTHTCVGAFLKSLPSGDFWANNTSMSEHYATGASRTTFTASMPVGTTPSDAKYLVISQMVNGNDWSPTTMTIDGYDYTIDLKANLYNKTEILKWNALAYVSGNAITWEKTTNGVCSLKIDNEIVIRDDTHSLYPIEISKASYLSVMSSATDYVTVTDDIVTGNSFAIYYDFKNSELKVSSPQDANIYKNSIILFANVYASYTYGALLDSANSISINQLEKDVQTLNDEIDSLDPVSVPTYLTSEVSDTIDALINASTEKAMIIAFATDNHYGASDGNNWKDTINTIKAINQKYRLDAVIEGGDMINGDETAVNAQNRLTVMIADMNIPNVLSYATVGNHDDDSFTTSQSVLLPESKLYALMGRPFSRNYDNISNTKTYGYKDFPMYGIRLIILDSRIGDNRNGEDPLNWGFDTDQISWLENVALDTDYQVVIFSHMGVTKEYSVANYQPVNGAIVREKIETFIANGGVVIGFFHGHTHWDHIGQYSETNGFHEVSTGCSRVQTYTPSYAPTGAIVQNRASGTVTQELYDIIVIKPESRIVNMIRFGAGNDRSFAY